MVQPPVGRLLLLQGLDAPLGDPAPYLAEEEHDEHGQAPQAELVAEDGYGEEPLRARDPPPLVELFNFNLAERAEEDALQEPQDAYEAEEAEVAENLSWSSAKK